MGSSAFQDSHRRQSVEAAVGLVSLLLLEEGSKRLPSRLQQLLLERCVLDSRKLISGFPAPRDMSHFCKRLGGP